MSDETSDEDDVDDDSAPLPPAAAAAVEMAMGEQSDMALVRDA